MANKVWVIFESYSGMMEQSETLIGIYSSLTKAQEVFLKKIEETTWKQYEVSEDKLHAKDCCGDDNWYMDIEELPLDKERYEA